MKTLTLTAVLIAAAIAVAIGQGAQAANEALWEAARAGDTAAITAALAKGADVNAKSRYDVTPLIFAAGSGRLEAVKLLIARGANVNAQDTFYRARAAEMAITNGHVDVTLYLLQNGAEADGLLAMGVQQNQEALVKAAVGGKVTRQGLQAAATMAGNMKREALVAIIKPALDKLPPEPAAPAFAVNPAILPKYAGTYRDAASGAAATVSVQNDALMLQMQGGPLVRLVPSAENVFRVIEVNATLTFNERGGLVESIGLVQGPANLTLARVAANAAAPPAAVADAAPATTPPTAAPIVRPTGPRNWPSFRGDGSAGNGDGQRAVTEWDVASGKNIKWKTPIPGVAVSSPIVWGNRIFATTAISKAGDNSFRTGLYGDVKPVDDVSPHEWKIYSLDKATGKILWERSAVIGAPRTKRHTKSSQASSTPVTDGRRVVAVFGSAGVMIAWDYTGKELWRVNLGTLDSGWFFDPAFQWGHSSSPIVYRNSVILQADVQKGSYIAAWDIATRQAAVEDGARRRDLDVGHADHRPHRRRTRCARHQRHEGARLRSGLGQADVDARAELGDHDRDAGRRQRSRLRDRRLPSCASDLRDPSWRRRRHLAAEGTGVEPVDRVEQHDRGHLHPDATALRRLSLHAEHQRHRLGLRPADRQARVPRPRGSRRRVLVVTGRRRRPTLYRERGR